ncbi:hypothetical protein N5K21_26310 [Rhizobium pusense]|uniref:hypothetical protein n=1 Tax=Agrobacterium pusense TaxID=648995 RepID=UPI00244919B4|nr:hypothetical protein [Agrobacterium pusense]MDH2092239.1 hypothetical protein [Agrobacterium pusense]
MSASLIHDIVPIGSLVAWSDGTPPPPERHRKKLSVWKSRNSQGRLVRKCTGNTVGDRTYPASFTLHESDLASNGTIVMRVFRTFDLNSDLTFTVIERPPAGSVRIFSGPGDRADLVYLAESRDAAAIWLTKHGYPNAVLEEVTADEAGVPTVERRAAA